MNEAKVVYYTHKIIAAIYDVYELINAYMSLQSIVSQYIV